jgi:hypothetical protein
MWMSRALNGLSTVAQVEAARKDSLVNQIKECQAAQKATKTEWNPGSTCEGEASRQ